MLGVALPFVVHGAITRILNAIDKGDQHAAAELVPLVYDELRKLAAARLARERPGHTLQPTALVHEAYARLLGPEAHNAARWNGRAHFFGAAAEAMRRILIDRARARNAEKRGGDRKPAARLSLDDLACSVEESPSELLDLDDALAALAAEDSPKAELVKLRFFGGLTLEQAGRVLGLSPATADRHWAYAKAWLFARLESGKKK